MIGSIDLQPSKYYTPPSSNSQITDHVDPELVTIPYVEDPEFGSHFDNMKVMNGSYKDEMHVSYDVEFTIDVDKKVTLRNLSIRSSWNVIWIWFAHSPIK